MAAPTPAYLEALDLLMRGVTAEDLLSFKPSAEAQQRVDDLLARNQEDALSPDERQELDDFLQLEHLMIMAKARARRTLDASESC